MNCMLYDQRKKLMFPNLLTRLFLKKVDFEWRKLEPKADLNESKLKKE